MRSNNSYNRTSKSFHWLVALLIIVAAILGWIAELSEISPGTLELFIWHKSVGITVLAVMILRLGWKLVSTEPEDVEGLSESNQRLAKLGHWALYLIAILMPLTGWVVTSAANFPFTWFGLFEVPLLMSASEPLQNQSAAAHLALFWILLVLVIGHVGMAFKHQLSGVPLLQRMVPGFLSPLTGAVILLSLSIAWVALAWISSYGIGEDGGEVPETLATSGQAPIEAEVASELSQIERDPELLWTMQTEESSLNFLVDYYGTETVGTFESFEPSIYFAEDNLEESYFYVRIDVTTARTGSNDMDPELPYPEWFHTEVFPESFYIADTFVAQPGGTYLAQGLLNLKGLENPVDLEFEWIPTGDSAAQLVGTAMVNRTDFNVGSGSWAEDSGIGFEVGVRVDLTLTRD